MKYILLALFLLTSVHYANAYDMIPLEIGFSEMPLELQLISICESSANMNSPNGIYGEIGIMQIHPVHFKTAKNLGFNVFNPNGNMAYALYLYRQNGLRDWESSKSCWKPKLMHILLQVSLSEKLNPYLN